MNIWMASREYAGIAESGGVKNVVCSLSEALAKRGHEATCFLPFYGSAKISSLENFKRNEFECEIQVAKKKVWAGFSSGFLRGVKIVLISSRCFSEKKNVYTYCEEDLENFPEKKIGEGYSDNLFMNAVFQNAIFHYGENFCSEKSPPEILHCHDACTAALPAMAARFSRRNFSKTKFVVSIHNAGPAYHHEFSCAEEAALYTGLPQKVLLRAKNGRRIEPYLLAEEVSALSTVSPWYAEELLSEKNSDLTDGLSKIFFQRKTKISGITNGIDFERYSPLDTEKSGLPFAFCPERLELEGKRKCREHFLKSIYSEFSSQNKKRPALQRSGFLDEKGVVYFSFHGRIASQKGIPVLLRAAEESLKKNSEIRFVISGQGESSLCEECRAFAQRNAGKAVFFLGYEKNLTRLFTAAADFALMPSEFEPCGTEDFIAQIFGTIPVAHATGGLKKIVHEKTGFLYSPNDEKTLSSLILRLAEEKAKVRGAFRDVIREGAKSVRENFSWQSVALRYEALYRDAPPPKK